MTARPLTARGPGRPRSQAIDSAILDATVDELIERGYLGLSIEAIAVRAGVAKTTVYRRWACLDELVLESMRQLQGPRPEPTAGVSARELLGDQLEGMRRLWTNPRWAALMRRVAADGIVQPEVYRQFRERLVAPKIAAMNRVLRQGVEEGLIRDDVDVDWVRQMLVAPVLASALTHQRVTKAQLAVTLDTVLAGLSP